MYSSIFALIITLLFVYQFSVTNKALRDAQKPQPIFVEVNDVRTR